jgi:catechol 2,3-dioxygenase-like lactoylglutathione lyase family enzyme
VPAPAQISPWCIAKPANLVHSLTGAHTDILIQAQDPKKAASFYVEQLGFAITDETPNLISLHGEHINLFIERGPALGPVLEVTVDSVEEAKRRLGENGCEIVKDEPDFPRCYVKDPFGLIYNLTR